MICGPSSPMNRWNSSTNCRGREGGRAHAACWHVWGRCSNPLPSLLFSASAAGGGGCGWAQSRVLPPLPQPAVTPIACAGPATRGQIHRQPVQGQPPRVKPPRNTPHFPSSPPVRSARAHNTCRAVRAAPPPRPPPAQPNHGAAPRNPWPAPTTPAPRTHPRPPAHLQQLLRLALHHGPQSLLPRPPQPVGWVDEVDVAVDELLKPGGVSVGQAAEGLQGVGWGVGG